MGRGEAIAAGPGGRVSPVAGALTVVTVVVAAMVTAALAVVAVGWSAPASAAPEKAMVRVAHFAPDVAYVDIYVVSLGGDQLVPNVFYQEVSSYWPVPAGEFTYEVRPAGSPQSGEPMVRLDGRLKAGGSYTIGTVGRMGDLSGLLLADDLRPGKAGTARARVVNAAVGLDQVDVAVGGTRVRFEDVGFSAQTRYRELPPGRYELAVRQPGAGRAEVASGTLAAKSGTVSSVVLVGGAGKPNELVPLTDAVGTARMPAGGIATGAGGTAAGQGVDLSRPAAGPVAAAAGLLLLGGMVLAVRARSRAASRRPAE